MRHIIFVYLGMHISLMKIDRRRKQQRIVHQERTCEENKEVSQHLSMYNLAQLFHKIDELHDDECLVSMKMFLCVAGDEEQKGA